MSDFHVILNPALPSMVPSSSKIDVSKLPLGSESVQNLIITRSDTNDNWIVSQIPSSDRTEVLSDFEYCLFPDENLRAYLIVRERLQSPLRRRSDECAQMTEGCSHINHTRMGEVAYPAAPQARSGWFTLYGSKVNRRCPSHGKRDQIEHLNQLIQKAKKDVIDNESNPANSFELSGEPFIDMWQRFSGLHSAIGRVILKATLDDAEGATRSITTLNDLRENRKLRFMSTILKPSVHSVHRRMSVKRNGGGVGYKQRRTACLHEDCLDDDEQARWVSPAGAEGTQGVTSQICRTHLGTLSERIRQESMEVLAKENLPVHSLAVYVNKSMSSYSAKLLSNGTWISEILSSSAKDSAAQRKNQDEKAQSVNKSGIGERSSVIGKERNIRPYVGERVS